MKRAVPAGPPQDRRDPGGCQAPGVEDLAVRQPNGLKAVLRGRCQIARSVTVPRASVVVPCATVEFDHQVSDGLQDISKDAPPVCGGAYLALSDREAVGAFEPEPAALEN